VIEEEDPWKNGRDNIIFCSRYLMSPNEMGKGIIKLIKLS
jgi:hypothetical protein